MAWIKTHYGREVIAPTSQFICDKETDVADLPTDGVFGSQAVVVETGNIYRLDSDQKWVLTFALEDFKGVEGPDGPQGPQGVPGTEIVSAHFDEDDLVFVRNDDEEIVLEDAKINFQGPQGVPGGPMIIDDTIISPSHPWSSQKITQEMASIFSALASNNYRLAMTIWFDAQGAEEEEDLTPLVEQWYRITRTGWIGGTQFYNTDQSTSSTGIKVGDNQGLVCVPSTNDKKEQDDYATIPLFAVTDCNWYLDALGKRHIRAIKGIRSVYEFVDTDPAHPVGVLQMAPWIKQEQGDTTYTQWMTDREYEAGFVPVAEAVDLDGTVHSWVVHAKYGMGDAYSSISGVPMRVWDVSHNSQLTDIPAAWGNKAYYGGKCSCDDAWMKLHVYIKYGSLTLDNIMNGCCSYSNSIQPALAETETRRVLVTTTQGANLLVGSTVCLGTTYSGTKSSQCSVLDRKKVLSIETVTIEDSTYSAINIDTTVDFNVTTDLFLTTMQWYTGSCDRVQGNDGSPYSNTSSKELYKLQGIEHSYGCYEIIADTILRYEPLNSQNVLRAHVCRDITKASTAITANYTASAYVVDCPASVAWTYIKRLSYSSVLPELWFPLEVGGTSATYSRDAAYLLAQSSGSYEWLSLGHLDNGLPLAGLSCLNANCGLSLANWSIGGRLSANGSRGEFSA